MSGDCAASEATTSFDETGEGGYDLSTRYDAVKQAMRNAEWHGHLQTSVLRDAVVAEPKNRRKRRSARRQRALRAAAAR